MIKSQWIIFATILQRFCRESFVMAMKKTGKKNQQPYFMRKRMLQIILKKIIHIFIIHVEQKLLMKLVYTVKSV